MTHEEFILHFYETIWTCGDVAAVDDFFAPSAKLGGIAYDMALKPEDFVVFAQSLLMLIEQPRFEILRTVSEEDMVSALIRCTGISARTGKAAAITAQVMMRFENGKIAEAYNHFDMLGLFISLDLMPANVLERMLAAEPLR
ncbi:ester cyclase [Palleronia sp.]|uniref:ester cyclase n=1 Tax=Palleronia sp. TaxID=1940284 RepID=UPI0035C84673